MTSLSDGLGPQKDPNSGRTRVESGPAGTHRPTTRRGSGIAHPSVPRARCPECLARRGCGPARAIVTPDAPPAIAARGSAYVNAVGENPYFALCGCAEPDKLTTT